MVMGSVSSPEETCSCKNFVIYAGKRRQRQNVRAVV